MDERYDHCSSTIVPNRGNNIKKHVIYLPYNNNKNNMIIIVIVIIILYIVFKRAYATTTRYWNIIYYNVINITYPTRRLSSVIIKVFREIKNILYRLCTYIIPTTGLGEHFVKSKWSFRVNCSLIIKYNTAR